MFTPQQRSIHDLDYYNIEASSIAYTSINEKTERQPHNRAQTGKHPLYIIQL